MMTQESLFYLSSVEMIRSKSMRNATKILEESEESSSKEKLTRILQQAKTTLKKILPLEKHFTWVDGDSKSKPQTNIQKNT
jgi:hypothetical protein